jgi:hypothetical protein
MGNCWVMLLFIVLVIYLTSNLNERVCVYYIYMYIYIPPKVTLTIYFSDHKLRIHSNYHWQFDIPEHESFTPYHWKHKMNACSIFLQSLLEYQIQYCISSLTKASQRYFKNDMTCSLAIGYISSSPIVVGSTFTNRNIQFCFFYQFWSQ